MAKKKPDVSTTLGPHVHVEDTPPPSPLIGTVLGKTIPVTVLNQHLIEQAVHTPGRLSPTPGVKVDKLPADVPDSPARSSKAALAIATPILKVTKASRGYFVPTFPDSSDHDKT